MRMEGCDGVFVDPFTAGTDNAGGAATGGGGGGGGGDNVVQTQDMPMGVYDHMMRPSMGHKMQVEIRESMQHYHGNKTQLQEQLAELCFDTGHLYTSPIPPSPTPSSVPSVKNWSHPGSKFNAAPVKAALKAHLAKLEQGSASPSGGEQRQVGDKNTLLPPITTSQQPAGDTYPCTTDAGTEKTQEAREKNWNCEETHVVEKKNIRFGESVELKTPLSKKKKKVCKKSKKTEGRRKSVLKDKPSSRLLKLPAVYGPSDKSTLWDSGRNHYHRKGKSVPMEMSRVLEDCQTFSHNTLAIPPINDPKRMEIALPPIVRTKGQNLKTHVEVRVVYTQSTPMGTTAEDNALLDEDHFHPSPPPGESVRGTAAELDDDSRSDVINDDDNDVDEVERILQSDRLQLPPLPVVRLSESKLSRHNFQPSTRRVPRLRLSERGPSPSLMSTATWRSGATGATGATYMSQETLEWKGEYMNTGSFNRKSRMLSEIVSIVRQRMRDNEEDLKKTGRPRELWDMDRNSPNDVMILNGDITPASNATTAGRAGRKHKWRRKRQLVSLPQPKPDSGAKLHDYLQKLSTKRRAAERRQQRERVRFQLANMTIREITQSSMGHHSTLHTAATTPQVA